VRVWGAAAAGFGPGINRASLLPVVMFERRRPGIRRGLGSRYCDGLPLRSLVRTF
jgi:hypothetical protein